MQQTGRKKERRRSSRNAIDKTIPILWEDETGNEMRLQGCLKDVSASGARILLPTKIPLRSPVTFNCPALAVGGRGTVRYCNVVKGGYEIGLEMSNGTGWRDQNIDLRNLAAGIDRANMAAKLSNATESVAPDVHAVVPVLPD